MTEDEHIEAAQSRKSISEFLRTGTGVLTSVAGVVGAVATLVAVGSQTGIFGGEPTTGSAKSSLASATSTAAQMHDDRLSGHLRVARTVDPPAITLQVPREWAWRDEQFDPYTSAEPGVALRTASPGDIDSGAATRKFGAATVYIGASKKFAHQLLRGSGASIQAKLRTYLRTVDWGQNGCKALGDTTFRSRSLVGIRRTWVDCEGRGITVQEFVALAVNHCYAVGGQYFAVRSATQGVLDRVISSVRVNPAQLPGACAK